MEIKTIITKKAYFDTNIFIYLLEQTPEYKEIIISLIEHLESINCEIYTSDLTLAECLVKPFADNDIQSQEVYKEQIKTSEFLQVKKVSRNILIEASRLRSVVNNKLPDSIHLATALQAKCDIFIGNDKKLKITNDIKKIILSELK